MSKVFMYKCSECHSIYEIEATREPPLCHERKPRRVYSWAGTIFRGTGFYSTDKGK